MDQTPCILFWSPPQCHSLQNTMYSLVRDRTVMLPTVHTVAGSVATPLHKMPRSVSPTWQKGLIPIYIVTSVGHKCSQCMPKLDVVCCIVTQTGTHCTQTSVAHPSNVYRLSVQVGLLDLPDEQNSSQHLGHDVKSDGHSGVPHRAVGNTAALWHGVEDVAPVLDALGTENAASRTEH